ncbi:preprotein translocase subunit YajC [Clostridium sp. Sa3CUN1]|uniref:Preprotein translocase subunit YajC n=1 Tax=Clostridium gallinarum TaxID=2762246 RepID=A0ABR8Q4Y6_9CLOT|nr:preprotein translocase subunit YajC [Clostridium gallinarum]MBD7915482.1 preprotein translocase subunit YajC [Clostridium gallinarum]
MNTQNIIFIVLIGVMFLVYFIISPIIKYKGIQENNKKHSDFLNKLNTGDKVVLNSGIFGTLKEKSEECYSIEISKGVIIKVLPSSIIGRS